MKEYLATQLLSGKDEAPGRTRWWPRHSKAMSRYLLAAGTPSLTSIPAIKNSIAAGAEEWEAVIYRARRGLMCEHAALETELVDAAMKNNGPLLGSIGQHLVDNARAQSDGFRISIPDFPHERYLFLLCQHVHLFIDSVNAKLTEDEKAFHKAEGFRKDNSIALAGLATEWF